MVQLILITLSVLSCYDPSFGSPPEILDFCLVDGGKAVCTDNLVYIGEKPQLLIHAVDEENNISRIALKLSHNDTVVYERVYKNILEEDTWEGVDEWILEFERLTGPAGDWQAQINVEDSSGLSVSRDLEFKVMSLSDCITLADWRVYSGRIDVDCELMSDCSRKLDLVKFTILATCSDGSEIRHITAFRRVIPGESNSLTTNIITNDQTVTSVTLLPKSLVIDVY